MGGCCDPAGYGDLFGVPFARHLARRYRRRGLDRTAERMVAFLVGQGGVQGASVLEIGGGVGDLQLELLRRGAARATNLELVDSYEADAAALAEEAGMADRVTRRHGVDVATRPEEVETHDIVVLHRVVCCYPDHEALLGAAARHATRLLVYSHPPVNPASRVLFGALNLVLRLRRIDFRTYLHDPEAMVDAARQGSLRPAYRHRGPTWQIVGLSAGAPF